jgi:H+-transporting ATPase
MKESMFVAQIEKEGDGMVLSDDFEFNHVGLTTEEAEERIKKYGKNELPEKVDPKWLIFVRLLWGPMPCLIWIVRCPVESKIVLDVTVSIVPLTSP